MSLNQDIIREFSYRTSRSSGAGGQSVNKTETRVEVMFDVVKSNILTETQKVQILERLSSRISKGRFLAASASDSRGQLENKQLAVSRMMSLLEAALKPKRKGIQLNQQKLQS